MEADGLEIRPGVGDRREHVASRIAGKTHLKRDRARAGCRPLMPRPPARLKNRVGPPPVCSFLGSIC